MDSEEYQINPSYGYFVHDGIRRAISALQLLALVADPETNEKLRLQIENDAIPGSIGAWIQEVTLGCPIEDSRLIHNKVKSNKVVQPYGISLLESIKERHIQVEVMDYITEETDLEEQDSFKKHADALRSGHDFIIKRYKEELVRGNLPLAFQITTEQPKFPGFCHRSGFY
jgi:hypothetical protein